MLLESYKKRNCRRQKYSAYENQIKELTNQIRMSEATVKSEKSIFDSESEEEYDVFVSHATEDKESFADEFVDILQQKYNLKVWYDAVSIR